jgi:hypothetical protein
MVDSTLGSSTSMAHDEPARQFEQGGEAMTRIFVSYAREDLDQGPHVPVAYVISKILAILDQEELSIFEQRGVLGEIAVLSGEDQTQADMLLRRFS